MKLVHVYGQTGRPPFPTLRSGHLRMAQSRTTSALCCQWPDPPPDPVVSGNRVAEMLDLPLMARWAAVVAPPAGSGPSGEGQIFPVTVLDAVERIGGRM